MRDGQVKKKKLGEETLHVVPILKLSYTHVAPSIFLGGAFCLFHG